MYAADISKKIRSAVKAKQLKGEWTGAFVPIGYQRDPKNINRLIIEESGAAVVRRIFALAREDKGSNTICDALDADGVLTPRNHYRWVKHGRPPKPARWNEGAVVAILRNRMYLGDMVQGIYDCPRFRRTTPKRKPKSEWIITPGTHEPIIDKETWELVQKNIDARHKPMGSGIIRLFSGFVKCEDCGRALTYANPKAGAYYSCGLYRRYGNRVCTSHYIRLDVLEQAVLDDIRKYAKLAKNESDKLTKWLCEQNGQKDANRLKTLTAELDKLSVRHAELEHILKRLYEDNVNAKLPDDMFRKFLAEYRQEQSEVQAKISNTEQQIKETEANQKDTGAWMKLIQKHTRIKKLDRAVLGELVDKIVVSEAKENDEQKVTDVTIYYRFIGAVS
ncbi:MAG: recombinase family protein [Oscillospiraceae bacterium]|nr:recombinase family protein [Oscillospiraceae bacterium]